MPSLRTVANVLWGAVGWCTDLFTVTWSYGVSSQDLLAKDHGGLVCV